jgi:hypothetical protein
VPYWIEANDNLARSVPSVWVLLIVVSCFGAWVNAFMHLVRVP